MRGILEVTLKNILLVLAGMAIALVGLGFFYIAVGLTEFQSLTAMILGYAGVIGLIMLSELKG
jgi:hypothetical protein